MGPDHRRRTQPVADDVPGSDVGQPGSGARGDRGPPAATMAPRDALLIFPEGGNVTPARRARAIERLRAAGRQEAARRAEGIRHLMPPRPRGVQAALLANPALQVVVVAHTGLDELNSIADIWAAVPVDKTLALCWHAVPSGEVPTDVVGLSDWLFDEWERMDAWVAVHRDDPTPAVGWRLGLDGTELSVWSLDSAGPWIAALRLRQPRQRGTPGPWVGATGHQRDRQLGQAVSRVVIVCALDAQGAQSPFPPQPRHETQDRCHRCPRARWGGPQGSDHRVQRARPTCSAVASAHDQSMQHDIADLEVVQCADQASGRRRGQPWWWGSTSPGGSNSLVRNRICASRQRELRARAGVRCSAARTFVTRSGSATMRRARSARLAKGA